MSPAASCFGRCERCSHRVTMIDPLAAPHLHPTLHVSPNEMIGFLRIVCPSLAAPHASASVHCPATPIPRIVE